MIIQPCFRMSTSFSLSIHWLLKMLSQYSLFSVFYHTLQDKQTPLLKLLGKLFHNKTAKINSLHIIYYTCIIIYKIETQFWKAFISAIRHHYNEKAFNYIVKVWYSKKMSPQNKLLTVNYQWYLTCTKIKYHPVIL